MRKSIILVGFLFIFLTGCASATLEDAIFNSGYNNDQPDILYKDDEEGIVIFLTKNTQDDYMIVQSTYEKNFADRYKVDTDGDYAVAVDITNQYEFITMDSINNQENTFHLIWGGVFQYPGAKKVQYSLIGDNGNEIYQSNAPINSKHVFVDILKENELQLTGAESVEYQVIDQEGNILYHQ